MRKLSREEWIAGAFELLIQGGISALRVEPLATHLGVTKGSFYHHFENRRALHMAMLSVWEERGTAAIIVEVEDAADDPTAQLRALALRTFAPDPGVDGIESAIRAWAGSDEVVAEAAERVDNRRTHFVVELLVAAGLARPLAKRRARLLYRALIGEFFWVTAGGPSSTRREIEEMVDLLLSTPD